MQYVTSFERRAIQRGIQQGLERGLQRGLQRGLERGQVQKAREAILEVSQIRFAQVPEAIAVSINIV